MDDEVKTNGLATAARIIAIIIFSLIMASLVTAIATDLSIFSEQIFGFFGACIASAIVFLFGCVLMLFSIMLVFGFYLLNSEGFWPGRWATAAFYDVMKDIKITQVQLNALITIRILLLTICIVVFIASIVALSLAKSARKKDPEIRQGLTKTFSILSLIFSIFGAMASGVLLLILTA